MWQGQDSKAGAPVRTIPDPIKRQVRQECHFGCVICGMPLFEYDHIERFADVGKHEASNLALLCPNHHGDKTSGRLSVERVLEGRKAPFNAERQETASYGLEVSRPFVVSLGSNVFKAAGPLGSDYHVVWINGGSFFALHNEGQSYTYSAFVTDGQGKLLLRIDHGSLSVATEVWDYQYAGTELTVRRGRGEILLEADISDRGFALRRGAFVDQYETGVLVKPNGDLVWSFSGLEAGSLARSTTNDFGGGVFGLMRQSCYKEEPPSLAIMRCWNPEYEQRAEQLRKDMEEGKPTSIPGGYPPGLGGFRPYPR